MYFFYKAQEVASNVKDAVNSFLKDLTTLEAFFVKISQSVNETLTLENIKEAATPIFEKAEEWDQNLGVSKRIEEWDENLGVSKAVKKSMLKIDNKLGLSNILTSTEVTLCIRKKERIWTPNCNTFRMYCQKVFFHWYENELLLLQKRNKLSSVFWKQRNHNSYMKPTKSQLRRLCHRCNFFFSCFSTFF